VYAVCMTVQIPVRIPDEDAEALDRAVASGAFSSRSDAVRRGIELLLKHIRDAEIEESYRRGYGKYPQEENLDGLALFAALVAAEENGQDPL